MKKIIFVSFVLAGVLFLPRVIFSQEAAKVDYESSLILDSDLDGLTDEGEKQIFKTDPQSPDSDADGFLDGTEVIEKTDPLDNSNPVAVQRIKNTVTQSENEVPWAWYLTRLSALLGFVLLYLSIFFGLSIRTPGLKKIINPCYSVGIHQWISLQALFFALLHGLTLFFDKFLSFSWQNIFIPFYPVGERLEAAGVHAGALSLGILAFYLMIILVLSSYGRRFIPHSLWRSIHFLNIGLYVISVVHALNLGSDLKAGVARNIFIGANLFLAILFVWHFIFRIANYFRGRRLKNEDLCESNPSV